MSDIQDLVKALVAMQPPRKIGADEYVACTPFHPDGVTHERLRRRSFQNGRRLDETFLSDEEIRLTNRLVPGRFVEGLVTVKESEQGAETDLHILYRSSTHDQRIALSAHIGSFRVLLRRCISEAIDQGLIAAGAADDPLASMVLPTKEPVTPRQRVQPSIPGKGETPFEYPDTTGTSADDAEAEEGGEAGGEAPPAEAPQHALQASAIDLLGARPIVAPSRRSAPAR